MSKKQKNYVKEHVFINIDLSLLLYTNPRGRETCLHFALFVEDLFFKSNAASRQKNKEKQLTEKQNLACQKYCRSKISKRHFREI